MTDRAAVLLTGCGEAAGAAGGHVFRIDAADQLSIIDGMIQPTTDDDIDLGSAIKSFKDALSYCGPTIIVIKENDDWLN